MFVVNHIYLVVGEEFYPSKKKKDLDPSYKIDVSIFGNVLEDNFCPIAKLL